MILNSCPAGFEIGSDLDFCVELRGVEPRTSCMPSAGSTSTDVYSRRSPSSLVSTGPPLSGLVAVLSCCTLLALTAGLLQPVRRPRAPRSLAARLLFSAQPGFQEGLQRHPHLGGRTENCLSDRSHIPVAVIAKYEAAAPSPQALAVNVPTALFTGMVSLVTSPCSLVSSSTTSNAAEM
jgi:hypothetical protein